jgi:hypothetical protein
MPRRSAQDDLTTYALAGLQAEIDRLTAIQRQLQNRSSRPSRASQNTLHDETVQDHGQPRRRKRTMSAEARRRISEAQKARWARQKAGKKK